MTSITFLKLILEEVVNLSVELPSPNSDLEGTNLGREGSIFIVSLYLQLSQKVYLIHVHAFGGAALSTEHNGASSKGILKLQVVLQIFFDIHNYSDAMFSLFQISIHNIEDLQLMQLATPDYPRDHVNRAS